MEEKWLMNLMLLISVIYKSIDVQGSFPGLVIFYSQIKMHTGNENKDVSLAQEFKTKKNIHGKKIGRKKVSCSGYCCGGTQRCENVL